MARAFWHASGSAVPRFQACGSMVWGRRVLDSLAGIGPVG